MPSNKQLQNALKVKRIEPERGARIKCARAQRATRRTWAKMVMMMMMMMMMMMSAEERCSER